VSPARYVEHLAAEHRLAAGQFALVDLRQDGRPRLVGAHRDPAAAATALQLLRDAGDAGAECLVVPALDPLLAEANA